MFYVEDVCAEMHRRYSNGDPQAVGSRSGFAASMIFQKAKMGYPFPTKECFRRALVEPQVMETVRDYPNLVLKSLEYYAGEMLKVAGLPLPEVNNELESIEAISDYSRQLCGILGGEA